MTFPTENAENIEDSITSGTVKPGFDGLDDKTTNAETPQFYFPLYESFYGPVIYEEIPFLFYTNYNIHPYYYPNYYGELHSKTNLNFSKIT